MRTELRPAFYATRAGSWRDYVNIFHIPYTLWHLSYVVMGAAVAPSLSLERTLGTLVAFFLAVGVAAHALDELKGRPLRTNIPDGVLLGLAVVSLVGAAALGVLAGVWYSYELFPLVVFGLFIVVAYNLELWGGRFHSDLLFAFAWGFFPAFTAYWVNALTLHPAGLLLPAAAFTLSLTQRTLSSSVRLIRRKTQRVEGVMEMTDGRMVALTDVTLVRTPERALRFLTLSHILLAAGLIAARWPGEFPL